MFEPAVRKAGRKGRLSRACLELSRKKSNKDSILRQRRKGPKALETSGTVVAGGMGIETGGFELLDELAGLSGVQREEPGLRRRAAIPMKG